jgi:hypothetical protein
MRREPFRRALLFAERWPVDGAARCHNADAGRNGVHLDCASIVQ